MEFGLAPGGREPARTSSTAVAARVHPLRYPARNARRKGRVPLDDTRNVLSRNRQEGVYGGSVELLCGSLIRGGAHAEARRAFGNTPAHSCGEEQTDRPGSSGLAARHLKD